MRTLTHEWVLLPNTEESQHHQIVKIVEDSSPMTREWVFLSHETGGQSTLIDIPDWQGPANPRVYGIEPKFFSTKPAPPVSECKYSPDKAFQMHKEYLLSK